MGKPGRPRIEITLSEEERTELERLSRRIRVNRNVAFRARLVLASASGESDVAVAKKHRTTNQTVGKWRKRFAAQRLDGLYDEPRVGGPRKITDEQVERVVIETLEKKPKGRTHWTTRKMAEKAGISASSVGRIWRSHGLKPHIVRGFKISNDPQFIEKVRDIVGLYMSPPTNAVVFSFDEKSQIQALERAQPVLPMDLGMPERQTHNYVRHGTLDLFAALNVATGEVVARLKKQHRSKDLVAFFREVDRSVDEGLDIHVILDNLSAHKSPVVKRWLVRNSRFKLHYTPTYASWLNLVERFFGLITDRAIRRGSFASTHQLRQAILDYIENHNEDPKPFIWTKSADDILDSIRRFGERTLQLHGGE